MAERNRPRRTFTLDPAINAYLGRGDVNAGRLIDQLVYQNVSTEKIRAAADEAGVRGDSEFFYGDDQ